MSGGSNLKIDIKKSGALLKNVPLFSGMTDNDLSRLASIARVHKAPRRETLFNEGSPADGFYVVKAGRVKLFKLSSEGKEQILRLVGPGETFAEAAVFSGDTFPAYAETLADAELLFFPRSAFVRLIESNPRLALNMLSTLSNLLRRFSLLVEELSLKEISSRLARYLVRLADLQGVGKQPKPQVTLEIGKAQLASRLGTVAETISRTFKRFKDNRWITVRGSRITLLDPDALKREAEK
jgi:CRP/FNR family transcriptional regulator, dissimilatory nitrate respiration regulator